MKTRSIELASYFRERETRLQEYWSFVQRSNQWIVDVIQGDDSGFAKATVEKLKKTPLGRFSARQISTLGSLYARRTVGEKSDPRFQEAVTAFLDRCRETAEVQRSHYRAFEAWNVQARDQAHGIKDWPWGSSSKSS